MTQQLIEDVPSTAEEIRSRIRVIPYRLIGILVPLLGVTALLSTRTLSFDGAMNMQVAQSIAEDGLYSRYYGGEKVFPSEIQTSSYFLLITAAAIKVFGATTLSFQAGNIVFLALLLTAVSLVLPASRLALLLVPGGLLLITPGLLPFSSGGYGEGAVAALAVSAFALLARAAVTERHHVRRSVLAMLCVGVAVSIKTVAAAMVPVALAGLAVVWFAHGRRWKPMLLALSGAAAPFLVFEAYRAISLGSGGYRDWWEYHFLRINVQATGQGLDEPGQPVLTKVADHFHLLATQTGVAAEWWLVLILALPVAVTGVVLTARWSGTLTDNHGSLLLIAYLTAYGLLYVTWWLAVTSTEKAWLRRVTIGLFVLILAAVLLTLLVARMLRTTVLLRQPPGAVVLALTALVATTLVAVAVPTAAASARSTKGGEAQLDAVTELSQEVATLADRGANFYGIGWWSAPVVSLYSEVDMGNLSQTDYCEATVLEVIERGDAYLVWDFYAMNLWSAEPDGYGAVEYQETDISSAAGTLWKITLPEGACT